MHPQGRFFCYPSRGGNDDFNLGKPQVIRKVSMPAAVSSASCSRKFPSKEVNKVTTEEETEKKKPNILKFIIWLLFLGLLLWFFFMWWKKMKQGKGSANKGRLVVAISSSAPRLGATSKVGNNLTKAVAIIDHIQILPTNGKDWVNVANNNQTIDLLALRNASPRVPQIVADANVAPGQYQKIKFHISKFLVEDAQGSKITYLPGNTVEFDVPFTATVKKDSVSPVILDIPLDESLKDAMDESGRAVKVFAPVINYESRSDSQISPSPNKKLVFDKPGNVQSQGTVSMDSNGQVDKGPNGIPQESEVRVSKGKVILSGIVQKLTSKVDNIKNVVSNNSSYPSRTGKPTNVNVAVADVNLPPRPDQQWMQPQQLMPIQDRQQLMPIEDRQPTNQFTLLDDADVGIVDEDGDIVNESMWKSFPAMLHGKYNRASLQKN